MSSQEVSSISLEYIMPDGSKVCKVGNSTGIMLHCTSTPAESEVADRELHMVMWEIAEKLWEKGDRSCMRTRRSYQ
jgi:hypothetical protein